MHPVGNRSTRLYRTAKTHKFEHPRDITKGNTKVRPITDEAGTYAYNVSQVILKPLCKNEYIINDSQSFSKEFSTLPPLEDVEEHVAYNVQSLFTNILVKETMDYIVDRAEGLVTRKIVWKSSLFAFSTCWMVVFGNDGRKK